MRISTIIITKNAEKHLKQCLDSVLWTDEIIVLDCGSDDNTVDICNSYSDKLKLHQTDWPGFGKQKNRALKLASGEWILSLDADEVVTPELQGEIIAILNCFAKSSRNDEVLQAGRVAINKDKKDNQVVAYKIPRLTYCFGKPVKYCFGHNKDKPIRLLKKNCGYFSDDIVHEKIIVNGEIGNLKQQMQHFSFSSIEDIINKMHSYSTLSATKLYQKQYKTTPAKIFLHAFWTFFRIYVLRLGFLDGYCGFVIALGNFEGVFYKYAKLMELYKGDYQGKRRL